VGGGVSTQDNSSLGAVGKDEAIVGRGAAMLNSRSLDVRIRTRVSEYERLALKFSGLTV